MGRLANRALEEERVFIAHRLVDPAPEQAIAAAQVMVEKAQRRTRRKGVQPQRYLGQLHGHGVFIDPVHASLEHHAPHNVAVVEPLGVNAPAAFFGIRHDCLAHSLDAGRKR